MTAENQNFTMRAGEVKDLRFEIQNPESVSLSGATARWWAAESVVPPSNGALITKEGLTIDDVAGTFYVTVPLSRADTLALSGVLYHELDISRALPTLAQIAAVGTMTVKRSIIRP